MKIRVTFAAALTAFCLTTSAWAGQPVETQPSVYKPIQQVEFEPEQIDGRTQLPDGVTETGRVLQRLPSLVRIRADFQRELLQTAEDI